MKVKISFFQLALIALIVAAAMTNPDKTEHAQHIQNGLETLGLEPRDDFYKTLEFHDYYVLSFVTFKDDVISIGLLHNLHTDYAALERAGIEVTGQYFGKTIKELSSD
jgi:hypothetical protein